MPKAIKLTSVYGDGRLVTIRTDSVLAVSRVKPDSKDIHDKRKEHTLVNLANGYYEVVEQPDEVTRWLGWEIG